MLFSSLTFVFLFLPIFLAAYYSFHADKTRNIALLCASLVFYSWCGFGFLGIMLATAMLNYSGGLWIERSENKTRLRRMLCVLITDIGILFFFKYVDFFIGGVNWTLGTYFSLLGLAAPIGMSFYIFKAVSYILDVYYGTSKAQRNPYNFINYIAMFPALLAGPIIKYHEIDRDLESRKTTFSDFTLGIRRFASGLAKKVLIADPIGGVAASIASVPAAELSVASAWIGAIAFAFQIYYDFSGYSDMAVGLGKMLGFRIPENFNYPFVSKSIQEYWQRWNITMSLWFKDYLFFPLMKSGFMQKIVRMKTINKKAAQKLSLYATLIIFWFLIGLWHGAAWTMIIGTGLLHAFYMIMSDLCMPSINRFKQKIHLHGSLTDNISRQITTFLLVTFGYVMLFSPNMGYAAQYIAKMFGFINGGNHTASMFANRETVIIMIIGALCAMPLFRRFILGETSNKWLSAIWIIALLLLSTTSMVSQSYTPFMYFQF